MNTRVVIMIAGAFGFAAGGCYATVDPQPVGYAEVTAAPVNIEASPQVVYEGHPTYFSGNRWWYRDSGRWTYYRSEPEGLARQRAYVQRAPAARREEPRREERAPERSEAPPAERVR